MTTKTPGGKITGLLALTMEAQEALHVGDHCHIVGDYEVEKADGSKPVLGRCSVANTQRVNTAYSTTVGAPRVPGAVTVEARGFWVETATASGALAAGILVGIDGDGKIDAVGAGVAEYGLLLTSSDADGDPVDVLVR